MLKVKLNINEKEIKNPEYITINEIQFNNKNIVFPICDDAFVDFINLKKVGEFYELSYLEGFNEDEIIVKIKDLEEEYHEDVIRKFLEFNSDIITEYEEKSLKETIIYLLNNDNCSISAEINNDVIILKVGTCTVLELIYYVSINSYGFIAAKGYIYNEESFDIACPNINFTLDIKMGENVSTENLFSLLENISDYYLKESIINHLK